MKKTLYAAVAALLTVLLAGCGGGADMPQTTATPAKSIGPQLRPCEATGPDAPPCPASQSAAAAR